jgi:hypothetical protein
VPRKQWAGEEHERPLTLVGLRQARRLVTLLDCWRPVVVETSPVAAVRRHRAAVHRARARRGAQGDRAHGGRGAAGPRRGRRASSGGWWPADEDAVVCTHRPSWGRCWRRCASPPPGRRAGGCRRRTRGSTRRSCSSRT